MFTRGDYTNGNQACSFGIKLVVIDRGRALGDFSFVDCVRAGRAQQQAAPVDACGPPATL